MLVLVRSCIADNSNRQRTKKIKEIKDHFGSTEIRSVQKSNKRKPSIKRKRKPSSGRIIKSE